MNWNLEEVNFIEKQLKLLLDPELKRVLSYIEMQGPIHRDTLANHLKINASELSGYLLSLEIQGHIHLMAGNLYCKL